MRAELAVTPPDFAKMVKAGLLIRERVEQVVEAFKLGYHGIISFDDTNIGSSQLWVKHVYKSLSK